MATTAHIRSTRNHRLRLVSILVLLAIRGASTQTYASDCPLQYRQLSGQHTMCLAKGPGTPLAMGTATRSAILQLHNAVRRQVQPPANDLVELHWDAELETVALKWACQCVQFGPHDLPSDRQLSGLPGELLGQNAVLGPPDWLAALQTWVDEKAFFRYGHRPSCPPPCDVSHYTQMVSNATYRVGCGACSCEKRTNYVCNYVTGYHGLTPYTVGKPCEVCASCSQGLCDCQGMVCHNGASLDPRTCRCACPAHLHGPLCENFSCPPHDPPDCITRPKRRCFHPIRPLHVRCPVTCQVCAAEPCQKTCGSRLTLHLNTCQCQCPIKHVTMTGSTMIKKTASAP